MNDTYTPVLPLETIVGILHNTPLAPKEGHHVAFARAIERAAIEAYQRQMWISINDQLPEGEEIVLVLVPGDQYQKVALDCWRMQRESPVSWSSATIETGMAWDDHEFEEVTHWMPLPPAPEIDHG